MRIQQPKTCSELRDLLQGVVTGSKCTEFDHHVAVEYWCDRLSEPKEQRNAYIDPDTKDIIVTLWDDDTPVGGVRVSFQNHADPVDEIFVRAIARVFDHDIRVCHTVKESDELWSNLRQSLVSRAIGRALGTFDGEDAASWINIMELSVSLTYENRPVRHVVIVAYKFSELESKVGESLICFSEALSFKNAILAEKWVRAVVDGKRVALVATKRNGGQVRGFLSLMSVGHRNVEDSVPHESLLEIFSILARRDVAFIVSDAGDLWILSGRKVFWQKTQGRWKYLNYSHIHRSLADILKSESLVRNILRICIDLAYERKGALFWLPQDEKHVKNLVIDHDNPITNIALRKALRGIKIDQWNQRQIIASAAGTDGATIVNCSGELVDIAVMLKTPSSKIYKQFGFKKPEIFPGARTTATWNASLYGVAVKVSEDGPITVWHHGKEIASLG